MNVPAGSRFEFSGEAQLCAIQWNLELQYHANYANSKEEINRTMWLAKLISWTWPHSLRDWSQTKTIAWQSIEVELIPFCHGEHIVARRRTDSLAFAKSSQFWCESASQPTPNFYYCAPSHEKWWARTSFGRSFRFVSGPRHH